jgi:hypothetical protein
MRKQMGLTRVDAAVALACIALVLAQAAVLNAGGRERSKREVCLANLKTLTAAWQIYADDNAGNLVNGAPFSPGGSPLSGTCPAPPAGLGNQVKAIVPPSTNIFYPIHKNELPWIGPAWAFSGVNWYSDRYQSECLQKVAIDTGSLWKYVGDYNIYRCPDSNSNILVTYSVIDSMNGKTQYSTKNNDTTLLIKNMDQIANPAKRIVFIEEGYPGPDSYAVYNYQAVWFDLPPVRHEAGVCVSFADGHSAYHKWKGSETIACGKLTANTYNLTTCTPVSCDGKNDLYWVQIGCWGQLSYTPSCPVNID